MGGEGEIIPMKNIEWLPPPLFKFANCMKRTEKKHFKFQRTKKEKDS